MPKVTITNAKGLVQSKGSGLVVSSATALNGAVTVSGTGVPGIVLSSTTSIIGGADDYDASLTQPANTIIVEVGLVSTTAGDGSGNVTVDFGTSAGGEEIVANTGIVSSAVWAVSTGASTGGLVPEGASALAFVAAGAVHTTAARTITCSVTTSATQGAGAYRAWLKYLVV